MRYLEFFKKMLTLIFFIHWFHVGQTKEEEERFFVTSVNCGMNKQDKMSSSIAVSGQEYSQQKDGINLIVYDIAKETVTQSKSFSDPNTKKFMNFMKSVLPGKLIIGASQILCTQKSATSFSRQKSILYALKRLNIDTNRLKPIVLRSAVFAYCKERCYPNITSSIELPYTKVHDFTQGPILLSFRIQKVQLEEAVLSSTSLLNNEKDDHLPHQTLYIIIVSCSVVIVLSVFGAAFCIIRRRKKDRQRLDLTDTVKFRDRLGNTKRSCELLFLSKEKSACYQEKERYAPTTSARLFSLYSNDGQEEPGTMDSFASYVKVETDDHHLIYKVPSGVSKHDPPLHPPSLSPLLNKKCTIKTITSSSEYLSPHDYEAPESRYQSVYQEVDPAFFEEYTSLEEPTDNQCEEIRCDHPIYDNYSADYIVP